MRLLQTRHRTLRLQWTSRMIRDTHRRRRCNRCPITLWRCGLRCTRLLRIAIVHGIAVASLVEQFTAVILWTLWTHLNILIALLCHCISRPRDHATAIKASRDNGDFYTTLKVGVLYS